MVLMIRPLNITGVGVLLLWYFWRNPFWGHVLEPIVDPEEVG